ncbi:hypothetical protein [Pedobacter sp. P26]|uniref:hypothetical protein n=1 Tax=Pedobacter sp. P26 TaxID=3423956 RepID=UPI003D6714DA
MKHEEAFYIGYVTKTRGLKGEVQVFFEFDEYEQLEFDVVFADMNGKLVPYFVASTKLQSNKTGYFNFDDADHIDKVQPLLKRSCTCLFRKCPNAKKENFSIPTLKAI